MPIKGEQGHTYKALFNGEWQDITVQESPLELLEYFEQSEEWTRVRHGHWIEADVGDCCYKCSECGFIRDAYILDISNYCPNCGAKMDEEKR